MPSKNFYEALSTLKDKIETHGNLKEGSDHSVLLGEKVEKFLENPKTIQNLKEYIETYNQLIDESDFFYRDSRFDHYDVSEIRNSLNKHRFFNAKHAVLLRSKEGKEQKVEKDEALQKLIEDEKKKILNNESLQNIFKDIDKSITKNADLDAFKRYLSENMEIIPRLQNTKELKQDVWAYYFSQNKDECFCLIKKYEESKKEIAEIENKAKEEQSDWEKVVKIFEERFHVPFEIKVENKADVALQRDNAPRLAFYYKDATQSKQKPKQIEKEKLLSILSQGEKRAFYILNIIFEIEARKKRKRNVLIIDDIADSFDYKNKYAIIEYLQEIFEENGNFFGIILSHNFDFCRTIYSRGIINREKVLHCVRANNEIRLEEMQYVNDPCKVWLKKAENRMKLIALIPFARNIVEYRDGETKGEEGGDYQTLTSLLHKKKNTSSLRFSGLIEILGKTFKKFDASKISINKDDLVINAIYEEAGKIKKEHEEKSDLERKVVLSIAIRLKAEEHMIEQLGDNKYEDRGGNQFKELFKEYEKKYKDNEDENDKENLKILKKVRLMTPENIHLNAFMYEPIIDMDICALKDLYDEVLKLASPNSASNVAA